jgi:hypothetical protein
MNDKEDIDNYKDLKYEALSPKQKEWLDAYVETKTISKANELVGMTFWQYQYWKRVGGDFMDYKSFCDESIRDWAEGKLFELMAKNNFSAIRFWLEKRHCDFNQNEEIDINSKSEYNVINWVKSKERYDNSKNNEDVDGKS